MIPLKFLRQLNWNRSLNKKGNSAFQTFSSLAVAIAGLTIALVLAFLVMSEGRTQMEANEGTCVISTGVNCGLSTNATIELQGAVDDVPGWVPLIVIGVVGAALLGLVKLFKGGSN